MIPKTIPSYRKTGFTLLEVMIALAILSIVAVAFLRAQAGSIRLVDEASQISLATLLAKEKMAELESIGFSEPKKNSGTGGKEFPMLRWEQVVSLTEVLNLRKAQVRVFWTEGTQERSLELTAYFARR
ncbi:MAG: type II secretion system minor pseudopilin GspI [Pseudomonadota bacterium]